MLWLLLIACRSPAVPTTEAPQAPTRWDDAVIRTFPDTLPPGPACTVIAMHGRGDHPSRFAALFDGLPGPVQVVIPRAPHRIGPSSWEWMAPPEPGQVRAAEPMAREADALIEALPRLVTPRPIAGGPVVTGFSQGGMIAYAMAVRHPEAVRAALPVGGELHRDLWPAPGGPTTRIHGFHGEIDQVVLVGPTRELVDALVAGGWPAELSVYPEVTHSIPPVMRADLHQAIQEACR